MRMILVIAVAVLASLAVSCSGGGGGGGGGAGGSGDGDYGPPAMGSVSDLPTPSGSVSAVSSTDEGVNILAGALSFAEDFVAMADASSKSVSRSSAAKFGFDKSVSGLRPSLSYTTKTESQTVTLSPSADYADSVSVSGTAYAYKTNWPSSEPAAGDSVNGSMGLKEDLRLTIVKPVTVSDKGATFELSGGKAVCKADISVNAKGTYPDGLSVSGEAKLSYGLACTIVDRHAGTGAKFLISIGVDEKVTSPSAFDSLSGVVEIYDPITNALIGKATLTGDELEAIVPLIGMDDK